jgi:hypothetical protein
MNPVGCFEQALLRIRDLTQCALRSVVIGTLGRFCVELQHRPGMLVRPGTATLPAAARPGGRGEQ